MRMDGQIALVELPISDAARSERFYEAVFGSPFRARMVRRAGGWSAEGSSDLTPVAGFAPTGEAPEAPEEPHTPLGPAYWRRPMIVLYARDIEATARRIVAAGGLITRPIFSVPNGRRLHFQDPDHNEMIVWSDTMDPPTDRLAQKMPVPKSEAPAVLGPAASTGQIRAEAYVSVWLKYARARIAEARSAKARAEAVRAEAARVEAARAEAERVRAAGMAKAQAEILRARARAGAFARAALRPWRSRMAA